jgi:hypothetical protein
VMSGIDVERQLVNAIASFAHDPHGFVRFAFPWGEEGSELASHSAACGSTPRSLESFSASWYLRSASTAASIAIGSVELELQQARYEASLAERRYAACDPDNRLIAAQRPPGQPVYRCERPNQMLGLPRCLPSSAARSGHRIAAQPATRVRHASPARRARMI